MPDLDDFIGEWRLDRVIDDRIEGVLGRLCGRARVRHRGRELIYDEEGELRLPGRPPMHATRRYLWRGGPLVSVAFADGTPFHVFDLRAAEPQARHTCGADLYRVTYRFADWPRWSATWDVIGPNKLYRAVSHYAPPEAPADACADVERRAQPRQVHPTE